MKNKGGIPVIGVLALLIGLLISVQIGTAESSDVGGLIPVAKAAGLEQELKELRAEKETIMQEYLDLEARLKEIEEQNSSEDALMQSMGGEIEKYKMSAGIVDVKGPGVIVTVDDPIPTEENPGDGYSTIMLRYDLLLSLVNKLKDAGAEAISINGQRIITSTEISLAGDNVNINAVPTAPPYTIKAIGNPDTIESTLTIRYGIVETMRNNYALRVDISQEKELTISRYSGVIKFRYAVLADDDE
ncbi:MAG: DUF881 domain-containing protein [Eubacteriales bacterium]|nr:DUF881 domain-containing protein [Eubacteriales bacterium]MDD3349437.1 DUF881 domain-containing protein [Eubacteriales bacterium]